MAQGLVVKARFRPMIEPILPPVTMHIAMTSVYSVIAVWMPVTVVPTSSATVAMDTFMTELSRVIRNCAEARVTRTAPAARPVLHAPVSDIAPPLDNAVRLASGRPLRRRACGRGRSGFVDWARERVCGGWWG